MSRPLPALRSASGSSSTSRSARWARRRCATSSTSASTCSCCAGASCTPPRATAIRRRCRASTSSRASSAPASTLTSDLDPARPVSRTPRYNYWCPGGAEGSAAARNPLPEHHARGVGAADGQRLRRRVRGGAPRRDPRAAADGRAVPRSRVNAQRAVANEDKDASSRARSDGTLPTEARQILEGQPNRPPRRRAPSGRVAEGRAQQMLRQRRRVVARC